MLIEIRIGPGKRKLTSSIWNVKQACGVPLNKIHRVPHITLYGGFIADYSQIKKVKEVIRTTAENYSHLPYVIDGCKYVEGKKGKVVYFNIIPSKEFESFRKELSLKLLNVVPFTKSFDKAEDFLFHSTLAYKLSDDEFNRVWPYVSGDKPFFEKIVSLFTTLCDIYIYRCML